MNITKIFIILLISNLHAIQGLALLGQQQNNNNEQNGNHNRREPIGEVVGVANVNPREFARLGRRLTTFSYTMISTSVITILAGIHIASTLFCTQQKESNCYQFMKENSRWFYEGAICIAVLAGTFGIMAIILSICALRI